MLSKSWFRIAIMVGVCVVLCSGCRKARPQTGGDLVLDSVAGAGDLPMTGGSFDQGTPIGASEFQRDNVLFDYDSFQIKSSEIAKIEKVAEFMKKEARVVLVCEGHCDERGSREYNMSLGEQRAQAVRAHMVGLGLAPERIQTKSYGKEKPLNPGHDEGAWRENRRVEFALYR